MNLSGYHCRCTAIRIVAVANVVVVTGISVVIVCNLYLRI